MVADRTRPAGQDVMYPLRNTDPRFGDHKLPDRSVKAIMVAASKLEIDLQAPGTGRRRAGGRAQRRFHYPFAAVYRRLTSSQFTVFHQAAM